MSSPSSADAPALPPPATLAIHLDLVGGLAGDMFVAALVDALPALGTVVTAATAAVRPQNAAPAAFTSGTSGGLRVLRFGTAAPLPGDDGHTHDGTPVATLRARIEAADLPGGAARHALALLALLADAEARVHGIAAADVHFHELADWDSLLDLVAAGAIAAALEGARWSASPPPLGRGTIRTAHGVLPVPAPATAALLTGYPWRDDGIAGERVTPTGAAILRHLVPPADCADPCAGGRLAAAGCGAGTRELPGTPNIVRALVFERAVAAPADSVAIVEFDVDDMTGEELAHAADRLRAEPGVVDVSFGTRHGKKGRALTDVRVLAIPAASEAVVAACFRETSTLGLRVRNEQRRVVRRTEVAEAVGARLVAVKLAERPGGERTAKAAHDDVAALSGLGERRRTRAEAERRALGDDDA